MYLTLAAVKLYSPLAAGAVCADRDGLLLILHHRSHRGRSSQVHRDAAQEAGLTHIQVI